MAKAPKVKGTENEQIEIEPGAWQRFERAVGVVAKSPPQPKKKAAAGKKKEG